MPTRLYETSRPVHCFSPMAGTLRITRPGGGVSLVFSCLHCGRRKKVACDSVELRRRGAVGGDRLSHR